MNILIGLIVALLIAVGIGGHGDNIERRQAQAVEQRNPLSGEPLDAYQREQCAAWKGWPDHYHPWYCGK